MLQALVHFSLKYRGVVVALACVLLSYGLYVVESAKLDVFPNFVQPQVVIQAECPGLAPEQVELLVTVPIESMVNGLGDMESLRSESIEGLSIITAVFKEGTDVFRARQTLAEKLAETAGELPSTVKTPRMTPLTSSTMDLLKIGLVSDGLTPMQLRTFADWTLKPRLLSVPGVAKCSSFGGEVRQLQIQVLPERLLAYHLSLSDVLAAARVSTGVMGAGFIETSNQRITLQTEGQALTADLLGEVAVAGTNGFSVRLKDVARVVEGAEPKFGDCLIQGRWGVLMTMSSQYGANTMEVTKALEAALEEMNPVFEKEGIKVYRRLHRPATFIEVALGNMKHSLALGGILVAVVLFLLLGSVRTACISLVAIPLSLLTAVIVLEKFGITLNTITLGGLAIALGEVVDDSIIDVENIYRRLREHRAKRKPEAGPSTPREIFEVVLGASLEVRRAVVFATFTVALIFLPVLTLTGLQGSFFAPLALSYILAILASLLVALTVTPALSFLFFGRGAPKSDEPRLQRWLKGGYAKVLRFIARWPRVVIVAAVVMVAGALTRLPTGEGDLLPQFREGHFVLQVFAAPGTSLPEMLRIGGEISQELLKNKNIDTVEQQVGRAELGEDPWGPHRSEFHVELKPLSGQEQKQVQEDIRELLSRVPGAQFEVTTFLGDRISETLTGEVEPVVVNIFGDDLDVLDAKAQEVANVLSTVAGHADVKVKSPPGAPRLMIRLRPDRLTQFAFHPVDVLEAIQTAYQGTVVAQTHRGNQTVDVAVILDPADRQDPEALGSLLLSSPQGLRLPLGELAEIYPTSGRPSILHEGARRRQTVTCGTTGRDVTSFVDEARRQVASKVNFPAGSYAVFSGAAEAKAQAQRELLLHSAIAAVGILLLLSVVFHNWRNLLLVLVNVPFALVGGVLAVWLTSVLQHGESSLTIGSLVGFVTLFGITTRNSIMMISHFEHLVESEGMAWGSEAVLRGASERLMPILMTATVTGLGLLPLALGSGEAGREIEGPMAIVILGGLITSTTLNLLVLPTLALRYGKFATKEVDAS
ncbi:MAG TPA: efflux RND transporter permease subunit [Candidatus Acidoferrum sp.]|jgi:CzcA family heavy metal efflux pump|nr:efflux RND transporter permease subunit [Candidatus Acidoferrum sp.]